MTPGERDKLQQIIKHKDQEISTLRTALQRTHNETLKLDKQVTALQQRIVTRPKPETSSSAANTHSLAREVAVLRRALSLDSPGILALVQDKESLTERVEYLTKELDKTRTERETLKSARELMTPRPELSHRLMTLEKDNRKLVAMIDEKKLEIQGERAARTIAEQAKTRHQTEVDRLRQELTMTQDELERLKEEKDNSAVQMTRLHQSLSVSALNESVMDDHVEKLKQDAEHQALLVNRLRREIQTLHDQLKSRDSREKQLEDQIQLAQDKHKESRYHNKQREKEILNLHFELERVQGLLAKQTAAQLKRLLC